MSENNAATSSKISESDHSIHLCSKEVATGEACTPDSNEKGNLKVELPKQSCRKRKNKIPRWIQLAEESRKRQRKIIYESSSDDENNTTVQPNQPKPE